jgi:hypothetical protein
MSKRKMMGSIIHLLLTTKYTVANNVYKNIKYLTEECSAEKDAAEMEDIRRCPRLEMQHDAK